MTNESGRWIPCTERLPEKSGRYLVTRKFNALFSLWDKVCIANYSDLMGTQKRKNMVDRKCRKIRF